MELYPLRPFTTFNFKVLLWLPGDNNRFICNAEFSDCDGLEMSIEPKTIREGGNNNQQIHLIGPVSYGQLSLKRGMTKRKKDKPYDLWEWFKQVQINPGIRLSGKVIMLSSATGDKQTRDAVFKLKGCLPIKLKVPTLNAKEGQIAIEEMQIAYESLILV